MKAKKQRQSQAAAELKDKLPNSLQRAISLSTEKGSSSWLSTLSITDEYLSYQTANREDGARLDVAAESFWASDRQCTFFDICVFNPFAPSYCNAPLAQGYHRNELEKKIAYDQRVREKRSWIFLTTCLLYY